MDRTKIIFLIILLLVALTLIGVHFSGSSLGPHGGIVKKAGNYNIELKTAYPYLYTFLLDKNIKPINNKGITCEARFVFSDNTDLNVSLISFMNDGFSTKLVTQDYSFVQILFNVKGEAVSSKFENENLIVKQ